jgi:hypothetical protein
MKTAVVSIVAALAISALVAAPSVIAQQRDKAPESSGDAKPDAKAACMEMMQGSGTTEEGKKAMQEFMQSPKAPQAMNNMMEMARGMGNGDTMLGMTKMMEMMGGGMGGMMGGQASPGMQRQK